MNDKTLDEKITELDSEFAKDLARTLSGLPGIMSAEVSNVRSDGFTVDLSFESSDALNSGRVVSKPKNAPANLCPDCGKKASSIYGVPRAGRSPEFILLCECHNDWAISLEDARHLYPERNF